MNLGKGCNSVYHPHGQRPPWGTQLLQSQAGVRGYQEGLGLHWAQVMPRACMPSALHGHSCQA